MSKYRNIPVDDIEEDCEHLNNFVDIHGNVIDVLKGDNGKLYVNVDDVTNSGFHIFKREEYNEHCSKEFDIKALEFFLLGEAKDYLISCNKTCSDDDLYYAIKRTSSKLNNDNSIRDTSLRSVTSSTSSNVPNLIIRRNFDASVYDASGIQQSKVLPDNSKPSRNSFSPAEKSMPMKKVGGRFFNEGRPNKNIDAHCNFPKKMDNGKDFKCNYNWQNNKFDGESTGKPPRRLLFNTFGSDSARHPLTKSSTFESPKRQFSNYFSDTGNFVENTNRDLRKPLKEIASVNAKPAPKVASNILLPKKDADKQLKLEKVKLELQTKYPVKVSYIDPENSNVIYVQKNDTASSELIEEILIDLNTSDMSNADLDRPEVNDMCMALFEDMWYRAIIHSIKPGKTEVNLIDYGNVETITTPVKLLSAKLQNIPAQAIRITLSEPNKFISNARTLEIDMDVEIYVKKIYENGIHLVSLNGKMETPICYKDIPPAASQLEHNDLVMLIGYDDTRLFVRNKKCAEVCKAVYQHLSASLKSKALSRTPEEGEIVVCRKSTALHRVIVKRIINESSIEIEFMDIIKVEEVASDSLFNADDELIQFPISKMEIDYAPLTNLSTHAETFLQNIIETKQKLVLKLIGTEFDLLHKRDEVNISKYLLSNKIKELNSVEVENPVPRDTDEYGNPRFYLNNMRYVNIEIHGKLKEYFLYNYDNATATLLSTEPDHLEFLDNIDITVQDDTPYKPLLGEMCLAKYGKDKTYYRAIVLKCMPDTETYEVKSVDFGHIETKNSKCLRKFSKKYCEIPILGLPVKMKDIAITEENEKFLKKTMTDETILEGRLSLNDNNEYEIEIPCVIECLKTQEN